MALKLKIVTPDKVIWDEEVDEVILPSQSGQMGILTNHAPLLTALNVGVLQVRTKSGFLSIAIDRGFAEVEDNEVNVLVTKAERGDQIDLTQAREALAKAQQVVTSSTDKSEVLSAKLNVERATARIRAAGGNN